MWSGSRGLGWGFEQNLGIGLHVSLTAPSRAVLIGGGSANSSLPWMLKLSGALSGCAWVLCGQVGQEEWFAGHFRRIILQFILEREVDLNSH